MWAGRVVIVPEREVGIAASAAIEAGRHTHGGDEVLACVGSRTAVVSADVQRYVRQIRGPLAVADLEGNTVETTDIRCELDARRVGLAGLAILNRKGNQVLGEKGRVGWPGRDRSVIGQLELESIRVVADLAL